MDWGWVAPVVSILLGGGSGFLIVWAKMAKYQQKVDDLIEAKKETFQKIDALRTDVDTLKEFRINAQKFIDKNLYEAKSPLQLSEFGRKIVEESGFVEIFEKYKNELAVKLRVKNPITKYDVQEKARALMDELGEYPPFQSIKGYAFKNGRDFLQILRAGGILLRDYYFSLHPEIKQ